MPLSLYRAEEGRLKLGIRGKLSNGDFVKFPAHRDEKIAEHMLRMVESLDRSVALNQLPEPQVVQWVESQPVEVVNRLAKHGLIDQGLLDTRRPLVDMFNEFLAYKQSNNDDSSTWPTRTVNKVMRVLNALGSNITVRDVTLEKVNAVLKTLKAESGKRKGLSISQKTRREYVFAIRSFLEWLVDEKGLTANPLRKLKPPSAKGDPVRNRRPLSVQDVGRLFAYLKGETDSESFPRIFDGVLPKDRLMVYWTAVLTGFRMEELRSLTPAHVDFKAPVTRITVQGWVAKNGQRATIPIPDDFSDALRKYASKRQPNEPLLRMRHPNTVLDWLYRDLDAAGVRREFDDGAVVDFHTLRSTAIFWWLTVNKLHILDAQLMARLKTLSLVQDYVDDYLPDYKTLVLNAPRLLDPDLPVKRLVDVDVDRGANGAH